MPKNPLALSEMVSDAELDQVLGRIDVNSLEVDSVVDQVVNQYCSEIDNIISKIDGALAEHEELSDTILENFVLRVPIALYYACTAAESLGVRDDVSRLIYREAYNTARKDASGTVADKDSHAAMHTQAEALAAVVYSRAFKKVRAKLDVAEEMLAALKKVVTSRISERSLSQADTNAR